MIDIGLMAEGSAVDDGNLKVEGSAVDDGNLKVEGSAVVDNGLKVEGSAVVDGGLKVEGSAVVDGGLEVEGSAVNDGDIKNNCSAVDGYLKIEDCASSTRDEEAEPVLPPPSKIRDIFTKLALFNTGSFFLLVKSFYHLSLSKVKGKTFCCYY